ncbi:MULTISPECIES: AraC family transcriptional regulator [unclassified Pseudoxanthomonas]|uniref:helix-turn-helix transcriptional regulator n=1 Tax=unclassified Pseudoxanthomonas TaxID=2645906 RepID=UPI003077C895
MNRSSFTMRPCAFRDVQAVEARSSHVFPRHTHDGYGIGLVVNGAHRSWSGRGMVEAGPGSLITCNPGEVHDGMPIGDSRAWKMLYLAPGFVEAVVADIREGATASFEFTHPVIEQQTHARAFELVYETVTGRCADAERAQERLILLLAGMLHKKPPSLPSASALARAKARIDDDPSASITLAALAREAGLSRFQVVRGFSKLTGLTPHAYIVQRRLDAARAMIANGDALADAAVACGFADQSHFNRMFVQRYGVTPGTYAEAMR